MHSGVVFNLVGAVFNQGSTLLVNIAVANLLGRHSFGQYTLIVATLTTIGSLGQLSMGYTATRHLAEFRSGDPVKAGRILSLCGVISAAAAAIAALGLGVTADILATAVLHDPSVAHDLRVAAAAVFFVILNGFLTGALAGLESYRRIAGAGIASGVVYAAVCTALAWTGGVSGAVAGLAISAAAQCAILAAALRSEAARHGIAPARRGIWQERRIVTAFALPASLTGLVTLPALWAASALLAQQPGGYDQLALFGAANSFRVMVLFVPQTINNVGMSVLNNQLRGGREDYRRVFWLNAVATVGAALAGAIAFVAGGPLLLRIFGAEFVEGNRVLTILLGVAVLEAISLAAYQVVVSNSRLWTSLACIGLPRDLGLVMIAAFLVPRFGAVGLATSHALGWVLGVIGTLAVASRLGLRPPPVPSRQMRSDSR